MTKKPLIEILSNSEDDEPANEEPCVEASACEESDTLDVSKILPKADSDELKKDVFKNFDKIESEFDTLD